MIIIGVIGVVAIAALAASDDPTINPPSSGNNGEYNYSVSTVTSFNYTLSGTPLVMTASAGNEYKIATITLMNTNYSGGIDTGPVWFKFNVNGVKYAWDTATLFHPDYKDTVTLAKGSKYTFTVVFQVPIGTTGEIVWDGLPPNVVYNSALV